MDAFAPICTTCGERRGFVGDPGDPVRLRMCTTCDTVPVAPVTVQAELPFAA